MRIPSFFIKLLSILCLLFICSSCKTEENDDSSSTIKNPSPVTIPSNPDTTAPSIVSLSPPKSSVDISIITKIYITFSEPMSSNSLGLSINPTTISSFSLIDGSGDLVSIVVSLNDDKKTVTIEPFYYLLFNTKYTIIVSSQVTDKAGNSLATEYSSNFITKSPANSNGTKDSPYSHRDPKIMPDGWLVEVIKFDSDAWPEVSEENMFNDPPSPGKKMVMVTVRVVNDSTDTEPNSIYEGDFFMVGSFKILYSTYGSESRCGVIPDDLHESLYLGGEEIGNVCFQVGENETNLLLIYEYEYKKYIYFTVE